jgi:hypothetical protein
MSIEREQDDAVPSPGTPEGQPKVRHESLRQRLIQPNLAPSSPDHDEPASENAPAKSVRRSGQSTTARRRNKKVDASALDQAAQVVQDSMPEGPPQRNSTGDTANIETAVAGSSQTRKSSSRKLEERTPNTPAAAGRTRAPRSSRQRAAEKPVTSQENENSTGGHSASSTQVETQRGNTTSSTALWTEQQLQPSSLSPALSASIPPITNEAIAFLSNPAAGPSDLSRLSADSQEFVRYHITSMERREFENALGHTHLLATAPRHSPQFEKAADALLSKLVREPRLLLEQAEAKAEPSSSTTPLQEKPGPYFGSGQPIITISLSKRISLSRNEQPRESLEENSIEPSLRAEQTQGFVAQQEQASSSQPNQTVVPDPVSKDGSSRFLRGMTTAFQVALTWLENRERGQEKPADDDALRSTSKPVQGSQSTDRSTVIPEEVARRFLKVERDYYFVDQTPAFSDRGDKLTTRGEHPEVVRSLVAIAIARGWDNVTVKGTESFRRAAWLEASLSGVSVSGYKPTALDMADLASRPAGNTVEKHAPQDRTNVSRPGDNKSDVENSKRSAYAQSKTNSHATQATEMPDPQLQAKAQSFDKEKPSFVIKKHPELAPAYGVIDAAKKFAESNLPEEAKEEFVGLARRHVMNKIMSGAAVVGPKVYTAQTKSNDVAVTNPKREANTPVFIERNRTKGIAREK